MGHPRFSHCVNRGTEVLSEGPGRGQTGGCGQLPHRLQGHTWHHRGVSAAGSAGRWLLGGHPQVLTAGLGPRALAAGLRGLWGWAQQPTSPQATHVEHLTHLWEQFAPPWDGESWRSDPSEAPVQSPATASCLPVLTPCVPPLCTAGEVAVIEILCVVFQGPKWGT